MNITAETTVAAPIEDVWHAYTTPEDIQQWNAASDDWHTTASTVDLRVGGAFSSRMEAKDGSMGFDFAGTYTKIVEHELIEYSFGGLVRSFGQIARVSNPSSARSANGTETIDSSGQEMAEIADKPHCGKKTLYFFVSVPHTPLTSGGDRTTFGVSVTACAAGA